MVCWHGAFTRFSSASDGHYMFPSSQLLSTAVSHTAISARKIYTQHANHCIPVFGVAEDCLFLSLYHSAADYARLEPFAFKMNVAWGWVTFGINTVMTIAILTKIL